MKRKKEIKFSNGVMMVLAQLVRHNVPEAFKNRVLKQELKLSKASKFAMAAAEVANTLAIFSLKERIEVIKSVKKAKEKAYTRY